MQKSYSTSELCFFLQRKLDEFLICLSMIGPVSPFTLFLFWCFQLKDNGNNESLYSLRNTKPALGGEVTYNNDDHVTRIIEITYKSHDFITSAVMRKLCTLYIVRPFVINCKHFGTGKLLTENMCKSLCQTVCGWIDH